MNPTFADGTLTAIFSVVNAVLIKPPPFAQPERLVQVWESNEQVTTVV